MIDKLDKYYLIEYSRTLEELENQEERIEILNPYGLKGTSSDGISATNDVHDSVSIKVSKLIEIKKEIEKLKNRTEVMGIRVNKALDKLPPQEKQIIRLRYIDRQPWPVIIHALFHKRKDYEEHYDKYRSNIYKMHRRALKNIQKADEQWAKD